MRGFFGAFVTGNTDGLINIESGQLFGFLTANGAHALLVLAHPIKYLARTSPSPSAAAGAYPGVDGAPFRRDFT